MITMWYRNINMLSIAYAFLPQLRSRLTLTGRAFLRNPWAFGERDTHSFVVTHTRILSSTRSITPLDLPSLRAEPSPSAVPSATALSFGDTFSPGTFSARSHSTSELLRTLEMVAASKPTYWLSKQLHILFHLTSTWGPSLVVWVVSLLTLHLITHCLTPKRNSFALGV